MKLSSLILATVVTAFWLPVAAFAQGGVGQVVVEESDVEPSPTAPPECGGVATYALSPVVPGIVALHAIGTGAELGTFVAVDTEVLALDVPFEENGRHGWCTWTLQTGLLALDGQPPAAGGMLRADVTLAGTVTLPAESFTAGTTLPFDTAGTAILNARAAVSVDMDAEQVPGGYGARAIGSSCTCPPCPLGGRFWIPFNVIGIGTVPGGENCCAMACNAACGALADGKTYLEAWSAGQGLWVLCMVCQ